MKNQKELIRMKKLFFIACIAGSMALLASSCKKNEEKEVTINLPQWEEFGDVDEGRLYVDFTTNLYKWNANDEVMFYNLDAEDGTNTFKTIYSTNGNAEGQTNAIFTGDDLGAKKDHYFVFYPVSKIVNGTAALDADNYETFNVPGEQTYTTINGNPTVDPASLAAACETENVQSFMMKHIFGVMRLKLKGVKTVDHLEVVDNSFNLSGNVTMKLHEVNMTTFSDIMDAYAADYGSHEADLAEYLQVLGYSSEPAGKTMVLNCPNGVQLSSTTQTVFYIMLRPGALVNGFKVNVYFTDGTHDAIDQYNSFKQSYCIKPGVIKGFAPSDVLGENL